MNPLEKAAQYGIVPVIKIPDVEKAVPLAKALIDGGLPLIEITCRNESALQSLSCIKKAYPEMLVGAGTVLTVEKADEAIAAGADFIVTPGFNPEVVKHCIEKNIDILPGCVTPTEIEAGMALGLSTFKFFPAEQLGGVKTMKELCGPYQKVKFVATSGINMDNLPAYMTYSGIAAVGGSFMAPAKSIEAQDWDAITEKCKEAVRTSHGFHLAHIGLNGTSEEEGSSRAKRFAEIFDMNYKKGGRSDFAGTVLESCKSKFPGKMGHIAIGTYSVERAIVFLESHGMKIRDEFKNIAPDGTMVAAYLEEEVGGFAIHLLRQA